MPLAIPSFLGNARELEIIGFIIGLIFWVQMIRLCAARETNNTEKVLWIAFMVIMPGIGALIYFFARVARPRL